MTAESTWRIGRDLAFRFERARDGATARAADRRAMGGPAGGADADTGALPLVPLLMAIVNVTPDSFSTGGRFQEPRAAVEHALAAVAAGAAIIDVGGESTRPGAARVDAEEQVRRVVPVIAALRRESDVPISIDTTRAAVAEAALDAGACIVNDTSAGLDDPRLLRVVAERGCGVVLMHRRHAPPAERWSHEISAGQNDAVVVRVRDELAARLRAALDAGVELEQIVLDPGLGFGKSVEENFALLAFDGLAHLAALGRPLLVGASRKSFLGRAAGIEHPDDRLAGSLAAAVMAVVGGASILRVHDVAPHREAMAVVAWTRGCTPSSRPSSPSGPSCPSCPSWRLDRTAARATITTRVPDQGETSWPALPR